MGTEIQVGMTFGTFSASVNHFRKKYDSEYVENTASVISGKEIAYNFTDKKTNQHKIAAYQGFGLDGDGRWKAVSIIQMGSYTFSKETNNLIPGKIAKSVNKFNRIDTTTHYAIDINGNGKVDRDEIFSKDNKHQPQNFEQVPVHTNLLAKE